MVTLLILIILVFIITRYALSPFYLNKEWDKVALCLNKYTLKLIKRLDIIMKIIRNLFDHFPACYKNICYYFCFCLALAMPYTIVSSNFSIATRIRTLGEVSDLLLIKGEVPAYLLRWEGLDTNKASTSFYLSLFNYMPLYPLEHTYRSLYLLPFYPLRLNRELPYPLTLFPLSRISVAGAGDTRLPLLAKAGEGQRGYGIGLGGVEAGEFHLEYEKLRLTIKESVLSLKNIYSNLSLNKYMLASLGGALATALPYIFIFAKVIQILYIYNLLIISIFKKIFFLIYFLVIFNDIFINFVILIKFYHTFPILLNLKDPFTVKAFAYSPVLIPSLQGGSLSLFPFTLISVRGGRGHVHSGLGSNTWSTFSLHPSLPLPLRGRGEGLGVGQMAMDKGLSEKGKFYKSLEIIKNKVLKLKGTKGLKFLSSIIVVFNYFRLLNFFFFFTFLDVFINFIAFALNFFDIPIYFLDVTYFKYTLSLADNAKRDNTNLFNFNTLDLQEKYKYMTSKFYGKGIEPNTPFLDWFISQLNNTDGTRESTDNLIEKNLTAIQRIERNAKLSSYGFSRIRPFLLHRTDNSPTKMPDTIPYKAPSEYDV